MLLSFIENPCYNTSSMSLAAFVEYRRMDMAEVRKVSEKEAGSYGNNGEL